MTLNRCRVLRQFRDNEAGNVFPLTAAAIFVMAGLVGGGVDMSRAYQVQSRLQSACDAGALAGRKTVTTQGFDGPALRAANNYFKVNFSGVSDVEEPQVRFTSDDDGNSVEGTASTSVNTLVVNILGVDEIPVSVTCSASMSIGNSDVVMVLDTTGSMDWAISDSDGTRRISALRSAMKNFYDNLEETTKDTNARIRYGFVPYNQSVNVGHLLDANWIVDKMDIQSREPTYVDVERDTDEVEAYKPPYNVDSQSVGDQDYGNWQDHRGSWTKDRDCDANRPNNTNWNSSGPETSTRTYIDSNGNRITETVQTYGQTRTEYQCYYKSWRNYWIAKRSASRNYFYVRKAIEEPIYKKETVRVFDKFVYQQVKDLDVSVYKTGASTSTLNGPNGTNQNYRWAGCIEERGTQNAGNIRYSTQVGFSPDGLFDLDIDSVPDSDETRWRPMWPDLAYVRTNQRQNRLERAAKSDHGLAVGSSCPRQAQLLSEMSKADFYAYADSLSPQGSTYHSIGMIWGARLSSQQGIFGTNVNEAADNGGEVARHIVFMTDGAMDTSYYYQSAWGVEWHDQRVTADGFSEQNERHNQRLLATCAAVKAKGIRVWIIALSTQLTSTLTSCGSSESSFTANSADELERAFQEIAKNVGELRITQ